MRAFWKSLALRIASIFGLGIAGLGLCISSAPAQTYKVLHAFCTQAGCPDGSQPNGGLLKDRAGNLYGTTWYGGSTGYGVAYELVRTPHSNQWTYRLLHNFCEAENCADGGESDTGFISDRDGNLYGVTVIGGNGGAEGAGTVFELMPNADRTQWSMHLLYEFCPLQGCRDGQWPHLGLTYAGKSKGQLYDGHSPLYGETGLGGLSNNGTVFELKPNGAGGWTERVIYDFCKNGSPCLDGAEPQSMLTMDASGNLYGTTPLGGTITGGKFQGVLFELSHSPGSKQWTEAVLHNFGCSDKPCATVGRFPGGRPLLAEDGNLYGVTETGDARCPAAPTIGCGTLYKIVPAGTASQWSRLYRFCKLANCSDGAVPRDGVVMDVAGNLYGVTGYGGSDNTDAIGIGGGTIFKFDGSMHVLHDFCSQTGCKDGEYPDSAPVIDSKGDLFGATECGGAQTGCDEAGVVYELKP